MPTEPPITKEPISPLSFSRQGTPLSGRDAILARLGWVIWVITLVFVGLAVVFLALSFNIDVGERWGPRGFGIVFAIIFGGVGALIISRQPRNWVGWIFCLSGLFTGLQALTEEYPVYALLANSNSLPLGETAAWISAWIWVPAVIPIWTLVLLLFPNGQPPST